MISSSLMQSFETHADRLRVRAKARREQMMVKSSVNDSADRAAVVDAGDQLGVRLPSDVYEGDTNLRTLRTLLKRIDDRGFERSDQQLEFHSAFERAASRVIYRKDWSTERPKIMSKNNWKRCSSEIMISTPRRFGKTFRCAAPAPTQLFQSTMALAPRAALQCLLRRSRSPSTAKLSSLVQLAARRARCSNASSSDSSPLNLHPTRHPLLNPF